MGNPESGITRRSLVLSALAADPAVCRGPQGRELSQRRRAVSRSADRTRSLPAHRTGLLQHPDRVLQPRHRAQQRLDAVRLRPHRLDAGLPPGSEIRRDEAVDAGRRAGSCHPDAAARQPLLLLLRRAQLVYLRRFQPEGARAVPGARRLGVLRRHERGARRHACHPRRAARRTSRLRMVTLVQGRGPDGDRSRRSRCLPPCLARCGRRFCTARATRRCGW